MDAQDLHGERGELGRLASHPRISLVVPVHLVQYPGKCIFLADISERKMDFKTMQPSRCQELGFFGEFFSFRHDRDTKARMSPERVTMWPGDQLWVSQCLCRPALDRTTTPRQRSR